VFTYLQQPRILHLESGKIPDFPCRARYELTLDPAHVLGQGSGDLPIVILGHDLSAVWNGPTGRAVFTQQPGLAPISISQEMLNGTFVVDGSSVVFEQTCESLSNAAATLDELRLVVPAVFSVFLPRPVTVTFARVVFENGTFRSELRRASYRIEALRDEDYRDRVDYSLSALRAMLEGEHFALIAAAAYMHVAERLSAVGNSSVEFAPEIILNLTKVLEVLFGNTRDQIRVGLTALGYDEVEREGVFIPLVILRNELDVGHAKLSAYSPEVLDKLYGYLKDVPLAMKELIVRATNATIAGKWQPPLPSAPASSTTYDRLLASIEAGEDARVARVGKSLYFIFARGDDVPRPVDPLPNTR
jgi:hypothetical protein